MELKKVLYEEYRKIPEKEKMKMIKEARQNQKYRRPNPQGQFAFSQIWWTDFEVYQGKDRIKLCTYRHYKSKDFSDAKAVLIMYHGLNSHIGHGAHIAHALAQIGVITVGFDHRGFGNSQGSPGYIESLQSHLYDSKFFAESMMKIYPNLPIFAMGLSMGGMTCYYLSLRNPSLFKGVIMMAPAIKNVMGGALIGLVTGIARFLPKSTRLIKPPRGQCAKNPQITQDIEKDKLSFSDRASLKSLETMLDTMDVAPLTFSNYEANFVIVQGGLDKLVNPIGAFELYDKCKSKDKEIWFYQDMWHDVWHEDEIYDIIERTKVWITQRLQ